MRPAIGKDNVHILLSKKRFSMMLHPGADPWGGAGGHGTPNGKISHDYFGVAMKNFTSPSYPHSFLS